LQHNSPVAVSAPHKTPAHASRKYLASV
jgi:hypothetical protein